MVKKKWLLVWNSIFFLPRSYHCNSVVTESPSMSVLLNVCLFIPAVADAAAVHSGGICLCISNSKGNVLREQSGKYSETPRPHW